MWRVVAAGSSRLPWVAVRLAELKGLSVEQVANATRGNFEQLFRIPAWVPAAGNT
jgi:hypothetical protein